jgi:hypothetical protein
MRAISTLNASRFSEDVTRVALIEDVRPSRDSLADQCGLADPAAPKDNCERCPRSREFRAERCKLGVSAYEHEDASSPDQTNHE